MRLKTIVNKPLTLAVLMIFASSMVSAQPAAPAPDVTKVDLSFNLGPIAVSVQMTHPVQDPSGIVWDTLHLEARDDTQASPFRATLDAVGQALDTVSLLGGFLPAAIAVEKDLAAGMALGDAVADAQGKTGVTITAFHDPTAVEYAVMLALIIVVCITAITEHISSPINPELSAIAAKMQSSLDAVGVSTIP
jgi:Flp pilus assembly pilin Flp